MIRRATEADVDAICRLEQLGAARPWSAESVRAQLQLPTTCAWVSEGPTVLAHVITSRVVDEAEVLTIVVSPTMRRRGLGAALLGAVMDHWTRSALCSAYLEVREDNIAARHLYERLDWKICGRRTNYYGPDLDAVLYRWTP